MPQDAKSGAAANEYGHETARLIGDKIGAISVKDKSNEFALEGRLVTIRCAHKGNMQVGVTYSMLDRVDKVIAAFEVGRKTYVLYEMSPSLYKMNLRDSKGEGKVGLVAKKVFKDIGKTLPVVNL